MNPVRFSRDDLASVLPPGGLSLISSCSAESALLAEAIDRAGAALGAMTFGGIFVPGLNKRTYQANPDCRILTFFMTPEFRALGDAVEFLPLCYQDIHAELRRRKPQAALFMCAPPDSEGNCSFGVQVDFIADLWRDIPVRIAHINPAMPATRGDPGIPFAALTAFCEEEQPLLTTGGDEPDALSSAIAAHIAPFVRDGATLQMGLGKIPGALLRGLTDRRDLRVHSGLVGDAAVDLIEAGAIADGAALVGVAVGSQRLYDAATSPAFQFRPVSITHDTMLHARIADMVTLNSAIEVDLLGQAYAELQPGGLMSGPGGASDFARGARQGGGLRIIALPSDAKRGTINRIVAPGQGRGPVSLTRMDIDLVVTEHGVADIRAKTYADRAAALIAVAAPQFRDELAAAWAEYARQL